MTPKVYLISGAPGVGKSSIVEKLREKFPHGFFIDVDIVRQFVGKADLNAHDENYEKTLDVVKSIVLFLVQSESFMPIFVIDCLNPTRMAKFTESILKKADLKQVVLWMNNDLLKERLSARKGHFFADYETAKKMNNRFLELKEIKMDNFLFLDRGALDVEQTVERILEER